MPVNSVQLPALESVFIIYIIGTEQTADSAGSPHQCS